MIRVLQNSNDEEISGLIMGDMFRVFVGALLRVYFEYRNRTYSTDPIDCLKSMGKGTIKDSGTRWLFSRLPK